MVKRNRRSKNKKCNPKIIVPENHKWTSSSTSVFLSGILFVKDFVALQK